MQCVIGSSNLLIELIIWEMLIYAGQGRQCKIDMNFSFATTYKLQKAHRNQAEELFHFTESSFLYNYVECGANFGYEYYFLAYFLSR